MSALSPGRQRSFKPTWEVAASIGVHALAIVLIWAGQSCSTHTPLFDPKDVMAVQAVALPKANKRMPDRATRTPDPPKGDAVTAKAPPPPKTASDMALQTKKAQEKKGAPDRSSDRADLLNKLKRESLLKDASAALGRTNRVQTDKDGVEPDQAVVGPVGAGRMDPELARYVVDCRNRILPNWNPLPAIIAANPDFSVVVSVEVGSDGALGKPTVIKSSSDPSFDRSAISAVVRTGSLPPPPPRYASSAAKGVMITLSAADLM